MAGLRPIQVKFFRCLKFLEATDVLTKRTDSSNFRFLVTFSIYLFFVVFATDPQNALLLMQSRRTHFTRAGLDSGFILRAWPFSGPGAYLVKLSSGSSLGSGSGPWAYPKTQAQSGSGFGLI
jgi:hypothetical protein